MKKKTLNNADTFGSVVDSDESQVFVGRSDKS